MDRKIIVPGAQAASADVLTVNRDIMVAIGEAAQALLGSTAPIFSGLSCTPNISGVGVVVLQGSVLSQQQLDVTPYGSLPANTLDLLLKMGINAASVALSTPAPTTAGQSIAYLIQAQFEEADGSATVLPYYNPNSTASVWAGPGGNGATQNTVRAQSVALQVKSGTPAVTGSQATPTPDTGWTGLWVVTVPYGATNISTGMIGQYSPAPPMLAGLLSSHHHGTTGQAPKVILTGGEEVQGVLPVANGGTGSSVGFAVHQINLSSPPSQDTILYPGDRQIVTFNGVSKIPLYCSSTGTSQFSPGCVFRVSLSLSANNALSDIYFTPNNSPPSVVCTVWCIEAGDYTNHSSAPYIDLNPYAIEISNTGYFYIDSFYGPVPNSSDNVNNYGPIIVDMIVSTIPASQMLSYRSGTAGGGALGFGGVSAQMAWSSLGTLGVMSFQGSGPALPDASAVVSGTVLIERLA